MHEAMCLALMLDNYEDIRKASEFLNWIREEFKDLERRFMNRTLVFLESKNLAYQQLP
jgi:hypothetical protein